MVLRIPSQRYAFERSLSPTGWTRYDGLLLWVYGWIAWFLVDFLLHPDCLDFGRARLELQLWQILLVSGGTCVVFIINPLKHVGYPQLWLLQLFRAETISLPYGRLTFATYNFRHLLLKMDRQQLVVCLHGWFTWWCINSPSPFRQRRRLLVRQNRFVKPRLLIYSCHPFT